VCSILVVSSRALLAVWFARSMILSYSFVCSRTPCALSNCSLKDAAIFCCPVKDTACLLQLVSQGKCFVYLPAQGHGLPKTLLYSVVRSRILPAFLIWPLDTSICSVFSSRTLFPSPGQGHCLPFPRVSSGTDLSRSPFKDTTVLTFQFYTSSHIGCAIGKKCT
jgi:hypothetical protein